MKKSLLALAALSAFAGGALAQSSVTLFGIVDVAATNIKNGSGGDMSMLTTDGNASSRLGFRGVEDLGGGLRAGFWIEGGMSADDGTAGGQTWRRRSTVSLLGNWGEIRMGRDYTPTFWNLTIFDPFGTNGIGSALNNTVATLGSGSSSTTLDRVRRDNTIGYFLPSWGGVYGQFMVAAGEGKAPNKYYGGRIGYAAGPVNIAGAYGMAEQDGAMVDDFTNWNIGGSWNFGGPTLSGYYGEYKYSTEKQTQFLLGLVWPIGAGSIKASWSGTSGESALAGGGDRYSSNQYAIGYVYDLSKRTAIYAHYSSLANDGDATNGAKFTVGGAAAGANNAGPAGMKGGETSSGYQFGIRHSF